MIKKTAILVLLTFSSLVFSQENVFNNYKYVIVPEQFDFLSETDQYQTSSLTKFLLEKKGFEVYLSNEKLPDDLATNRCLGLVADVKRESNMLTIKNFVEFKDCYNKVIYTSKIGKSKIKDYKRGYQDAIRNAFATMNDVTYSYKPKPQKAIDKNLVDEIKIEKDAVNVDDKSQLPIDEKEIKESIKEDVTVKSAVMLYAQANDLGYQLVNTKPEVVFIILKTSKPTFFIIKNKNGILYRKDTNWMAEYYEDNQLVKKEYSIKF